MLSGIRRVVGGNLVMPRTDSASTFVKVGDTRGHVLLPAEAKCAAKTDWDTEHVLYVRIGAGKLSLPKSVIHCGSV